jgi:peptidoglycan/LPS O-acetylase OafA/YrhL
MAQPKLTWIQSFRGIAALMVLLFHANEAAHSPYPALFSFGQSGVDIFFVLSGFIIFYVHSADAGQPSRLPRYLYRRMTRIYPPYWLASLAVLFPALLKPGWVGPEKLAPGSLLESFSLLPLGFLTDLPLLPVGWTLFYEIAFYLIFAATLLLPKKAFVPIMAVWLAASLAHCLCLDPKTSPRFAAIWLSPHTLEFSAGMALAFWQKKSGPLPRLNTFLATASLLAGLLFLAFGPRMLALGLLNDSLAMVLYAGGIGVFFLVFCLCREQKNSQAPAAFRFLGDASYSLYLVHFPIIAAAAKFLPAGGVWAYAAIALCGGIAFYLFAEKPLLKLLR